MRTRRQLLGALSIPAACSLPRPEWSPNGFERAVEAFADADGLPAAEVARDESRWFEAQQAFACDRSAINLNNGGVCPAPRATIDALKRHVDFSNALPARHLWQIQGPQHETVRVGLARLFGCDAEEIAITRNASESLQTCQLGFDLAAGDEVLTTTQDYPRMLTTFAQRARREGIVLRKVSIPVPCEEPDAIVRALEQSVTPRTKLILICHVINLTGQRMPVRAIVAMARARGIPVIVDGAHSFANLDFKHAEIDCEYFGTSLHKWLFAPHGTGMLYVRRDKIRALWPMMAADEKLDDDIRKFEEIGTHPAANFLAIAESLAFHFGIGPANKEARLRYLRERWARRLLSNDRVRMNTSLLAEHSGTQGNVRIEGLDTAKLQAWLWDRHRIFTVAILHDEFAGLRISPSVHNTLEELDLFCEAIEHALEKGLPA